MRSAIVVCVVISTACAARGPSPQIAAEMETADTLLAAGCYRCLEEALAIYQRAAATPRPPRTAKQRVFEAALLLTVRAKELGLPSDTFLEIARAAVPTATTYFNAAAFVVGELSGLDPEVRQQAARRPRPATPDAPPAPARAALEPLVATDLVAQYLALAIDCEDARARTRVDANAVLARHGQSPLLRYRLGLCGLGAQYLTGLRDADARWTDTLFVEGRAQMSMRPVADVQKAVDLFTAARDAFPASQAIVLALANAQTALAEYAAALENYDGVLAAEPEHRDALLGRVINVSYLNRHTEGIAAATKLIDLGTWHTGDAYYWRAWNRYYTRDLPRAWDDIERATKLLVNTSVYTLAGYIATARRELDVAIDRFDQAFRMDKTNCEAVWAAGLVHVDQEAWGRAGPKFATAAACFTAAAAQAREQIAQIEAATAVSAVVKARRLATEQKRRETSEHRAAQSSFNAAQSFVRLGDKAAALPHVEAALIHPQLRDKAEALKSSITKTP